jgi:hypothetical protein
MWKEAVVACFKILCQHSLEKLREITRKPSVRVAGIRAEIRNRDLPKQK